MRPGSTARQVARFALTGGLNTLAGLAAIAFAQLVLRLDPIAANVTGYVVGLVVSWTLNSRWTFAGAPRRGAARGLFLAAFIAAYTLNLLVLRGMLALGAQPFAAQMMALIAYSSAFFALNRFVVFRPPASAPNSSGRR